MRLSSGFPLGPGVVLALLDPWRAVVHSIIDGGDDNVGFDGVVVWLRYLDVWSSVLVVVRLKMRRNSIFDSEVMLAHKWRGLVAFFESRRAAKEYRQDSTPSSESAERVSEHDEDGLATASYLAMMLNRRAKKPLLALAESLEAVVRPRSLPLGWAEPLVASTIVTNHGNLSCESFTCRFVFFSSLDVFVGAACGASCAHFIQGQNVAAKAKARRQEMEGNTTKKKKGR